ncbi:MAG TPA: outer membrane protein transport protein [Thermoanaerobaculia bacterium]|nr:outer membrane protein transport protein [Thermoanaerobaculia bacterium]
MRPRKGPSIVAAVFCIAVAFPAHPSGFSIFEQGAKASAIAGAFVATADDPSAIFYNVAGLAQQRRLSVYGGATLINFSNQFRGDPNDDLTSGQTGVYRRHTFAPPNAYAVVPIGENLTFGVGAFSGYGLRTDWAAPWIGRFISSDADLKTASVEPAIAWQSRSGAVALGAGVEYRRARVTLVRNNSALNPFNQRVADAANVYLSGDWESAWGFSAGILLKPNATWRMGASYRADMDIDFEGTATFTQIPIDPRLDPLVRAQIPPNQGIRTSIPFPAVIALGVATTAIPNWDIEADITHTTWSRFQTLDIEFATTPQINLHRDENWDDTLSYRLGGNRRINENWDVRLGAIYDENPQPTKSVGPLLPDSDRWAVTFGFGYRRGPFTFDFSDMLLHFKDRSTNGQSSDNFNGTYKTDGTLISVNFGYTF